MMGKNFHRHFVIIFFGISCSCIFIVSWEDNLLEKSNAFFWLPRSPSPPPPPGGGGGSPQSTLMLQKKTTKTLPSLSLDVFIIENRDVSQKLIRKTKQKKQNYMTV